MTSLERNGDVVRLASYAPLLCKEGHSSWDPDLIYFSNTWIRPSVSYFVQQMFSANAGDTYLPITVSSNAKMPKDFAASAVTADVGTTLILKLVNNGDSTQTLRILVPRAFQSRQKGSIKTLVGKLDDQDGPGTAPPLLPITSETGFNHDFAYVAPPHSLTVIRLHRKER